MMRINRSVVLIELHMLGHRSAICPLPIDFEQNACLRRSGWLSSKALCKADSGFDQIAIASSDTSIGKAAATFEPDANSVEIIRDSERHRPELPITSG